MKTKSEKERTKVELFTLLSPECQGSAASKFQGYKHIFKIAKRIEECYKNLMPSDLSEHH